MGHQGQPDASWAAHNPQAQIAAGAPANNLIVQNTIHHGWNVLANKDANGNDILLAGKLPLIHTAVLGACDALDRVVDCSGSIDDAANFIAFTPHNTEPGPNADCSWVGKRLCSHGYQAGCQAVGKELVCDPSRLLPGHEDLSQ